ncbi:Uncharacterised protein [BD1-7 clade bacterium]|uniref:Uncharacterized protein n=1 Tax=BD1-7 clade bacterium TaxID=2029982 RepID=A0A5S9PMD6_9GAMM|nr:Uncharacterised protein [BD1-7 clade bacterium]
MRIFYPLAYSLFIAGCVSTGPAYDANTPTQKPQNDQTAVYFYRQPANCGELYAIDLTVNNANQNRLAENTYAVVKMNAGNVILGNKKSAAQRDGHVMSFDAGSTHFVKIQTLDNGSSGCSMSFVLCESICRETYTEVDERTAKAEMSGYKLAIAGEPPEKIEAVKTQSLEHLDKDTPLTEITIFNADGSLFRNQIDITLSTGAGFSLDKKQFSRFKLPEGEYDILLGHLDLGYFTSEHKIRVTNEPTIYSISSTPTAHKVDRLAELPENFKAFREVHIESDAVITAKTPEQCALPPIYRSESVVCDD